VNADVFVINPASPEVAMSLIKSNRLNLTSGMELVNNGILKSSIGAKVYYFRNEVYQDSFFISQLTSQNVKEIIKFKKQNGVAGDIGTYFQFQNAWVPKFSFILKNLNSTLNAKEEDLISENQMRPILLNEFYSRAGLGYDWRGEWGIVNTELGLPFRRAFEELYTDYIALSLGYTLSRFTTSISYSKYQQVFGFNFGSKLASIGIFYGRSQPLGDFSTQKDNVAGIRIEVSL
jgi:hypothetical protein